MRRVLIFVYGILASLCWFMAIYSQVARPMLPATNERLFIAFTIAGIVMTLIWLAIVKTFNHGKTYRQL